MSIIPIIRLLLEFKKLNINIELGEKELFETMENDEAGIKRILVIYG